MRISDWSSDVCSSDLFREIAQRPGDFALVGVTGALTVENGRITRAGIAWFGMGPTPMKARQAEAALIGQEIATLDARANAERSEERRAGKECVRKCRSGGATYS